LISAYGGRCAVTGCDAEAALEAAHIMPYLGPKTNHVSNGLLLRADVHTLFDLDLIGIDPESLTIALSESLRGTYYDDFQGRSLTLPKSKKSHPSQDALEQKWEKFVGQDW
jgi:predicted restriction endonuclease